VQLQVSRCQSDQMQRQSTIIIAEWIRIHHVVLDFKGKYENHRIDQKHARDRLAAAGGSHLRGSRWWQPRPWQPLVAATLATDGRQGGAQGDRCAHLVHGIGATFDCSLGISSAVKLRGCRRRSSHLLLLAVATLAIALLAAHLQVSSFAGQWRCGSHCPRGCTSPRSGQGPTTTLQATVMCPMPTRARRCRPTCVT